MINAHPVSINFHYNYTDYRIAQNFSGVNFDRQLADANILAVDLANMVIAGKYTKISLLQNFVLYIWYDKLQIPVSVSTSVGYV